MALVEVLVVEDTRAGPIDVGAIDGEEITLKVVDGELLISNGASGVFGTIEYSVRELADGRDPKGLRLEIRVKE